MATGDHDGATFQPPQHPVPHLQGPFEESMMESMIEVDEGPHGADPVLRRRQLLQGETYERVCAGRWKQRPGEKFHPLWKLSAQLSFGIHLLARGLAKSEEEVMRILQSHVDDVDGFLERTTQDFDLAQSDVDDRLRYLRLPLEHVDVFDHMLEDRAFRASIVDGNEKIEHIVERTSAAMKDALKDVQKGIDATAALGTYLADLKTSWKNRTPDLDAVYNAMIGNVEGWTRAFVDLHAQGNRLTISLTQLAGIIAELQRRAGIVSRKGLPSRNISTNGNVSPAQKSATSTTHPTSQPSPSASTESPRRGSNNSTPHKPLPLAPDTMTAARQASRAKLAHQSTTKQPSREASNDQPRTSKSHSSADKKALMTDKVRSAVKLGPYSSTTATARSSPGAHAKSPTRERQSHAHMSRPPKSASRQQSARSPTLTKSKEHGQKPPAAQSFGPIELPAEVPKDMPPGEDQGSKKGGLHFRLGSKHRDRDPAAGSSPSRSFNLFRRSGHNSSSGNPKSPPSGLVSPSTSSQLGNRSSSPKTPAINGLAPSQEGASSAPRQTSSPGLPPSSAPNVEGSAYERQANASTKQRNVPVTGSKAKTAQAPPRLLVPTSTDVEPEKTPRAFPSKPLSPVDPNAAPAPAAETSNQDAPGSDQASGHTSAPSTLGEPGPEVSSLNDSEGGNETSTKTSPEDEKTPVARDQPMEMPMAQSTSSSPPNPSNPAKSDYKVTSATMRSFSDFCKLPPHHPSPTPLATPDATERPPPFDEALAAEAGTNRPAHVSAGTERAPTTLSNGDEQAGNPSPAEENIPNQSRPSPTSTSPAPTSPTADVPSAGNGDDAEVPVDTSQKAAQPPGIFDLIASTPPHSAIHVRSGSEMDDAAASNNILAPPLQAPPPPAPGGRAMIKPDFASAGALEGERRSSKRGRATSNGAWKKKFGTAASTSAATGNGSSSSSSSSSHLPGDDGGGGGGGATASSHESSVADSGGNSASGPEPSRPGSAAAVATASATPTAREEIQMSANLMSGKGNDVLWYKGMGKDGLWVSGA